jgi:cbb3-type cytochrome oxidase subunit 3
MFGELFKGSETIAFPLFALIVFITVFTGVVVRAWRGRPQDERMSSLPLADDEEEAHDVRS